VSDRRARKRFATGYVAFRSTVRALFRNRLKRLFHTKLANLQQGEVCTVSGRVIASHPTVVAPIDGQPCVYYLVGVDGSSPPFTEGSGCVFALDDGTGRVLVDPMGAVPDFALRRSQQFGTDDAGPVQFLATRTIRYDFVPAMSMGISHVRQWRLVSQDQVTITGAAFCVTMPSAASNGYRETVSRLLFTATATTPLTIRWR
jgi:hypothetical protein